MKPEMKPSSDLVWNLATVFVLAFIPMIVAIFLVIFFEPQSSLNPLPPPTLPARLVLPTATATPLSLPPTWTPTFTATTSATPAPLTESSATAGFEVISGTPLSDLGNAAPTETVPPGYYAYATQSAPQAISASLYDADRGCAWMGIAGRVFDLQNSPVTGIRVALYGFLDGHTVQLLSLTGTAVQYGPSGYEFTLADTPIASTNLLYVRLLDQSDLALSDKVYFDTYNDCNKNLILIDFKQVR